MKRKFIINACDKLARCYVFIMAFIFVFLYYTPIVYAASDMWTVANTIIVDLYNKIAGI